MRAFRRVSKLIAFVAMFSGGGTVHGEPPENASKSERAALERLDAEIDGAVVHERRNHIYKVVVGEWEPIDLGRGEYARWAPDGKRIAVYDRRKVYVMRADGSDRRGVTGLARERHGCPIEFHTNGREIVFVRGDVKGLWAVEIDSGDARLLADRHDYSGEPGVSADGRRLAARAGNRLYAIDLDEGREFLYMNAGCSSGVSPDGRWLMNNGSDSNQSHSVMNIRSWSGDTVKTLRADICQPDRAWDNHHWSNHNDYIAAKGDRQREIYVVNTRDKRGTRVTWSGDADYPDLYVSRDHAKSSRLNRHRNGAPTRGLSAIWRYAFAATPEPNLPAKTLNANYDRRTSSVLVRCVEKLTRAILDLAAWDKNVIAYDPSGFEPEPPDSPLTLDDLHFDHTLDAASLVDRIEETPLTAEEMARVMSWEPMAKYVMDRQFDTGQQLAEAGWIVEETMWKDDSAPRAYQRIARAYLHGEEVWAQIEFQPWVGFLSGVDDEDNDGFPEIYGRLDATFIDEGALNRLRSDYLTRVLTPDEIAKWEATLVEDWYGPYYTIAVPAEERAPFPNDSTEPKVREELGELTVAAPAVVIRGEPHGKPVYTVIVRGCEER